MFVFYIKSPVVYEMKIHKNINCVAFSLIIWFRIISFYMKLILYTFKIWGLCQFFGLNTI